MIAPPDKSKGRDELWRVCEQLVKAVNALEAPPLPQPLAPPDPRPPWSNDHDPEADVAIGTIKEAGPLSVDVKAPRGWERMMRKEKMLTLWFQRHKLPVPDLSPFGPFIEETPKKNGESPEESV